MRKLSKWKWELREGHRLKPQWVAYVLGWVTGSIAQRKDRGWSLPCPGQGLVLSQSVEEPGGLICKESHNARKNAAAKHAGA